MWEILYERMLGGREGEQVSRRETPSQCERDSPVYDRGEPYAWIEPMVVINSYGSGEAHKPHIQWAPCTV